MTNAIMAVYLVLQTFLNVLSRTWWWYGQV